jgi:hypothetical protein
MMAIGNLAAIREAIDRKVAGREIKSSRKVDTWPSDGAGTAIVYEVEVYKKPVEERGMIKIPPMNGWTQFPTAEQRQTYMEERARREERAAEMQRRAVRDLETEALRERARKLEQQLEAVALKNLKKSPKPPPEPKKEEPPAIDPLNPPKRKFNFDI